MTLYLKYRPQTISQLDSAVVREQLTNLINSPSLPHALLFSGPKGTGKTSAARILAKIVNCEKNAKKLAEPCNTCSFCISTAKGNNFDVIEMDAASNRGIDDIRSLKEKIILSPGAGRKKIYIIDEVHMLTTEAFNALLKTLEEPPEHVIFILATTDPQKLPATVRSRLIGITFEKAKENEVVRQLTRVAKSEKLDISEESLKAIAKASDGAFRDSVKTLEAIIANLKKFDPQTVSDYLFKTKLLNPQDLLTTISKKDVKKGLTAIEQFANQGGSVTKLIDDLTALLHDFLLESVGIRTENETSPSVNLTQTEIDQLTNLLLTAKSEMAFSTISQLPLQIAIVKFCKKKNDDQNTDENDNKKEINNEVIREKAKAQIEEAANIDANIWHNILTQIKGKSPSVEGFLKAAKLISCKEDRVTIGVYYRFHKEQLELANNKRILQDALGTVTGNHLKVEFVLAEKTASASLKPSLTATVGGDILEAAKEIFGT